MWKILSLSFLQLSMFNLKALHAQWILAFSWFWKENIRMMRFGKEEKSKFIDGNYWDVVSQWPPRSLSPWNKFPIPCSSLLATLQCTELNFVAQRTLNTKYWILIFVAYWTLNTGHRTLNTGYWILHIEQWMLHTTHFNAPSPLQSHCCTSHNELL